MTSPECPIDYERVDKIIKHIVAVLFVVTVLHGVCLIIAAESVSDMLGGAEGARYIVGRNSSVHHPLNGEQAEAVDVLIFSLRVCGYGAVVPGMYVSCVFVVGETYISAMSEIMLNETDGGAEFSVADLLEDRVKMTGRIDAEQGIGMAHYAVLSGWFLWCVVYEDERERRERERLWARDRNRSMMRRERARADAERSAVLQQLRQ